MALVNSEILAKLDNILKVFESKYNGNINNPEFIGSIDETTYYNAWADYWRYVVGVNVVPMITRFKTAHEKLRWTDWQTKPIPEEQHEQWKSEGKFNQGMAIICGTVWHNPEKRGLYLNGIDADNLPAVNEFCNYKGKQFTVQELAAWTLVEQHDDAPHKMHIIVYSEKPFLVKGSSNNSPAFKAGIEADQIPAIEVKSSNTTFLFVSGSPHKGSATCPYKIVGTREPAVCDDFQNHINNICTKYHIPYLDADNGNGKAQIPIEELFEEDFEIYENNNRSEALMRVMESLIKNNRGILSEETLKHISRMWNEKHCKPPLDDKKFYGQWQDAKDFIARVKKTEEDRKRYYQKTAEEVDKMSLADKIEYMLGSINMVHPKEMIERFNFKCMIDTRELYYYDDVKHTYVDNGGIIIEQELEANWLAMSKIYAKVGAIVASLSEQELENLEESILERKRVGQEDLSMISRDM